MTRLPRYALFLALVLGASSGCKRLKTGAREEFGKKYSCPEASVEVRERPDLRYGDLILAKQTKGGPPDEVRNDPARFAKWQSDQAKEGDSLRKTLNDLDVFEAKGCGHEAIMGCGHPGDGEGGTHTTEVSCWEVPK